MSSLVLAGCGGKADLKIVGAPDTSSCGDETVDTDEKCDDGNTEDGDGCSKECEPEAGYVCIGKKNSSCAKTCGNDKLDEGEACEDGSIAKGDGCDASCQLEGSCKEPLPLVFESGVATIDSSTSSGGGGVDATDCNGENAGAGADRVYQVEVTEASDITITLSSSFNGLVRFQDAACDGSAERACANDQGAGGEESITVRDVTPGTYFVVVDGANASASGNFTLTVKLGCPLSNLKLTRATAYWQGDGVSVVELTNKSKSCALNLGDFHLGFFESWPTNGIVDVPLKKSSLGAGKTFLVAGTQDFGVVPDQYSAKVTVGSSSMIVAVCRGACSQGDSDNVLDLIQGGYVSGSDVIAPALPGSATFKPTALTRLNNYFQSYVRKSFAGKNGKFLASDWTLAFDLDADKTKYLYGFTGMTSNVTPGGISIIDDPAAEEGKVLHTIGGASTAYTGYYISLPDSFKPRTVSVRMARPAANANYIGFGLGKGVPDNNYYDGPLFVYDNPTLAFLYSHGVTSGTALPAFDASAWHTESFNIDWSASPVTFDFSVDGTLIAENLTMTDPIFDVLEISTLNANDTMNVAEIHMIE